MMENNERLIAALELLRYKVEREVTKDPTGRYLLHLKDFNEVFTVAQMNMVVIPEEKEVEVIK